MSWKHSYQDNKEYNCTATLLCSYIANSNNQQPDWIIQTGDTWTTVAWYQGTYFWTPSNALSDKLRNYSGLKHQSSCYIQ